MSAWVSILGNGGTEKLKNKRHSRIRLGKLCRAKEKARTVRKMNFANTRYGLVGLVGRRSYSGPGSKTGLGLVSPVSSGAFGSGANSISIS